MTKFARRTVALFIVGVLVAPAITECAGWSASAAGRHVCCANRGDLAPETTVTDCCGMSDPSNDAAPPDMQAAPMPLKVLGPQFALLPNSSAARTRIPAESSALRRAAVVPLYLQQASLLI